MGLIETCQAAWTAGDLSTCKPMGLDLGIWFGLIGFSLVATCLYFAKAIGGFLKSVLSKLFKRRIPTPSRLATDLYGRDAELSYITDIFTTDQRVVAVTNQGGIGKTALASEYGRIQKHAGYYQDVAMISTASDSDIVNGLRKIAADLGVADNKDPQTFISLVYDAMTKDGQRYLLILDNVDDEEARRRVLGVIRQSENIHQIITSRLTTGWPTTIATKGLTLLSPEAATEFLAESSDRDKSPELRDLAVKTLGRLPLALTIAAGHLKNEPTSIKDYTEDFQNRLNDAPQGTQYERTLHVAVMGSVDRLSKNARALMALAAYMHPDDIYPEFFIEGLIKSRERGYEDPQEPYLDIAQGATTLNTAFAECQKQALLTPALWEDHGTYRVHRITQVVMQTAIGSDSPDTPNLLAGFIGQFGRAQFSDNPQYDVKSWPLCRRLSPHARFLSQSSVEITESTAKHVSPFVNEAALFTYHALGDLHLTRHLYENNLPMMLLAFGDTSQQYASAKCNLGDILNDLSDYETAEKHIRDAIDIEENAGRESEAATVLNTLGTLFYNQQNYKDALTEFNLALKLWEKTNARTELLGTAHGNIGVSHKYLAKSEASKKTKDAHMQSALKHETRALEYTQQALGFMNFATTTRYNNISRTYAQLEKTDEAISSSQTALAICYAMLDRGFITDPNHRTLLTVLGLFKHHLTLFGRDPNEAEALARAEVPSIIEKHREWERQKASDEQA